MSNLFSFVKPVNEELYTYCLSMEKFSKTHPTTASGKTRNVVECFMKWFFDYNGLSRKKENDQEMSIYEMINEAQNRRLLLKWQVEILHNLRKYGNQFNHTVKRTATVTELMKYVKDLHKLLVVYFRYKQLLQESLFFSADKLLIDDYLPIKTLNLKDYEEGCEKKFLCERVEEGTDTPTYYVVRQFRRGDKNAPKETSFLTRDLLTLQRLSEEDLTFIVKNHNISLESDNELFFTCYELSEADTNLVDMDVKTLSVAERLQLISQIANGLDGMHHADEPVYHRALTPSSIYLKIKRNGKRSIRIGNFEYSKLEDVGGVTMLSKVYKRNRDPFRAPELDNNIKINDWTKTDIYSFGMIILYMFQIKGYDAFMHVNKLKKHGLSNAFIELVTGMVDEYHEDRPDMDEVLMAIKKEVKSNEQLNL